MRKYILPALILIIILFLFWQRRYRPVDLMPVSNGIDLLAIERFWKVTHYLEDNVEPPEEAWGAMFFTPGYARLLDTGLDIDAYRKNMSKVFMPILARQLDDTRIDKLDTNIRYFLNIRDHESRYRSYSKHLGESPVLERAIALVRELFPKGFVDNFPQPQVAFVFHPMQPDYGLPIVADLVYAHQEGNLLNYQLGHHAHHYYREKLLAFNWPEIGPDELDLVWAIDRIQAEGLANRINERYILFGNGPQVDTDRSIEWQIQLLRVPKFIPVLDSLLVEMASYPEQRKLLGAQIKARLPMEGHAVGYFMSKVIAEFFTEAGLTRQVGNPFGFMITYNMVAKSRSNKNPALSEEAEKYLRNLERRYVR